MVSGWFVFAVVGCIILCSGAVLAAALMRAAWAQKERESLTSTDLRALEESAVLLVDQIKSEADRVVADLDERCVTLRELVAEVDQKINVLKTLKSSPMKRPLDAEPAESRDPDILRVLDLAERGLSHTEIARITGLDCGEVQLVLGLNRLSSAA